MLELKNKSLSWIRGFNYHPGFAGHGIPRWLDRYDETTVERELRRGQELFPWMNTVRIWLSLDAWRDNRRLFLENLEKEISLLGRLGLKMVPVVYNGSSSIPDYGCLNPTDADRVMKQDGGANLNCLYLDYIRDIAVRYARDERIALWDLCNEPGLNYAQDDDPVRKAFMYLLAKSAEELRKYQVAAPLGVGNYGPVRDDEAVLGFVDCLMTHRYWVPHCMKFEKYIDNVVETVAFANAHNLAWCCTECSWGAWEDEKRVETLESMRPLMQAGAGFLIYILAESPAQDAHGKDAGVYYDWGSRGDSCLVRRDGTLRPGHGRINQIVAECPAAVAAPPTALRPAEKIIPGARWSDTDGKLIQAHGGGFLKYGGKCYWFGENKGEKTYRNAKGIIRADAVGISCYSSTDLVHWRNEGVVLPAVDDAAHDLSSKNVMERPKVLFNPHTEKFVMYFHLDNENYKWKDCGMATADRPEGPYVYQGRFPLNGEDSGDLTLYQDDDGTAYYLYTSENNETLHLQKLDASYLAPDGAYIRLLPGMVREAPAIIKKDGIYYLVTSGCTGWEDNRAMLATAEQITGKWLVLRGGDICFDRDQAFADKTFRSQSTYLLEWNGEIVFMADRWNIDDLHDSRYIWLPAEVGGRQLKVYWRNAWLPGESSAIS